MPAPLATLSHEELEALVLSLSPLAEREDRHWQRYWARKIRDAAAQRILDEKQETQ